VRLFGVARRGPAEYLLMGRTLALPSFVATLVSTWYGGVLGVGEYSYRYGISNWIVFGVPYYLGAAVFALFFAKKARRSELYTVPDQLDRAYGKPAALMGAVVIQDNPCEQKLTPEQWLIWGNDSPIWKPMGR